VVQGTTYYGEVPRLDVEAPAMNLVHRFPGIGIEELKVVVPVHPDKTASV